MRRALRWLGILALFAAVAALGGWLFSRTIERTLDPDPVTIAQASLQAMREQNRLTPFAARYVAVVTSTQRRFGLEARKTLIMPGDVRYEVDLGALEQSDLRWDAATRRLEVTLPPVEVSPPAIDLAALREYDGGGVLMRLTNAEDRLDAANRGAGQAELLRQARGPVPMRLARDAARRAVERSFAMPLRAAGLEAEVAVRFRDEPRPSPERVDRSRSLEEVYSNRQ
jgi:hypothetical protein